MSSTWLLHDDLQAIVTFVCGVALQIFFLYLPIDLKNWRDDALNILTYLAFQSFWGGLLFFLVPLQMGAYSLSWGQGIYVFLVLNIVALARVVQKIPLERSYPVTAEIEAVQKVAFGDLYTEDKRSLIEAAASQSDSTLRMERIRLQLVRLSGEKAEVRGR